MPSGAFSQSSYSPLSEDIFSDALEHYRNFDYEKAAQVFGEIDDIPEARLLRGNSLYALGRYQEAVQVLESVLEAELLDVSQEARYALGLTELSRRNYEAGLLHLQQLDAKTTYIPELQQRAEAQIREYARFFTFEQRRELLESPDMEGAAELAFILLEEGMRLHEYARVRPLYTLAQQLKLPEERIGELRGILQTRQEENTSGNDTPGDKSADTGDAESPQEAAPADIPELSVPEGFTYHIGVVLPQQEPGTGGYEVSRALYYGLLMAAEEYDQTSNSRRVQLHLVSLDPAAGNGEKSPVSADSSSAEDSVPAFLRNTAQLLETQPLDLLFGPLFTSEAAALAKLAKEHEIPLIAPLANSEDLTEENLWFFHANPTFEVRGQRMAEIVTQYLGQRRISILVERGSLGEADALAFRERAIELGAEIPYFFNENLQSRQFDIRPFARFFTSDVSLLNFEDEEEEEAFEENLKPSDALYVPLTGQPAPTIFNLLTTQLRALRSNLQMIGSQELGSTDISEAAARRFSLVYPETFHRSIGEEEAFEEFEEAYEDRFGNTPRSFSYIGYNIGGFMQHTLDRAANPQYARRALRLLPEFEGLGQRIHFAGGQVNTALLPMRFEENEYQPMFIPEEPVFNLIEEQAEEVRRRLEQENAGGQ